MWRDMESILDDEWIGELDGEKGGSRIEDRTNLPSTRKTRKVHGHPRPRPKNSVYALVLHQMACCRQRREGGYDTIGVHYAILQDGRILQLQPIEALMYASNSFNPRSVAVEFAGNFPNMKGGWWNPLEMGCDRLTKAQVDSGRYLIDHLRRELSGGKGLTHILAHRQSSKDRENDPGPDIWYHVGEWAINKYKLSDGGRGSSYGGYAIPDEWRAWGRISNSKLGAPATVQECNRSIRRQLAAICLNRVAMNGAVRDALSRGQEAQAIKLALAGDPCKASQLEDKLTNTILCSRHPRGFGQTVKLTDQDIQRLANEWRQIRIRLVSPAVRAAKARC